MSTETAKDMRAALTDLVAIHDLIEALASVGLEDSLALSLLAREIDSVFSKLNEIAVSLESASVTNAENAAHPIL